MSKGPKQTLLKRVHTDGQQVNEKMLNITHLTPGRMAVIKNTEATETSAIMENHTEVPQNIKNTMS